MRKRRSSTIIKKIFFTGSFLLTYVIAMLSLPYIQPLFEKATIVSAEMSFLGNSRNILFQTASSDFENIPNENEVYPFIEEQLAYAPVSSEEASSSSDISQEETPPENAGSIRRQTYHAGNGTTTFSIGSGFLKNCTKLSADTILKNTAKKPKFKIKADGSPEVLIMHTHATESYQDRQRTWFSKSYNSRTTDNNKNVTRIGDEIQMQLESVGIGVIHDKTLHDYPSYNGAYERSAETVKRILKEHPTIKVVLDVHRDAIQPDADTMIAPVTTINGKSCAQIMIISGCDDGTMNMPNYMENLKFSSALQNNMEKSFPTLTRPILFDYRKYNQNLTTGSVLLEMGGHANTLEEAVYAGELAGKALADTLLSLK